MNDDVPLQLLLDLDGAVIRYLAANHASLVASCDNPDGDSAVDDLLYHCTVELRDAANAVLAKLPR